MSATNQVIRPEDLVGDDWMKDPVAEQEFERLLAEGDKQMQPVVDAVVASAHLSEEDLAIRINARD